MERLDKKYAIVYIDWEGDSLKIDDFITKEMINDYYNQSGFLQWNFYTIVPKELFIDNPNVTIDEFINNESYTRKFVYPKDEINNFVAKRFPDMNKKFGSATIVKGKNWAESLFLANNESDKGFMSGKPYTHSYGSFYRDLSMMDTLERLDIIRAELITNPDYNILFNSHISQEYNIAEKKFKLFTQLKN
jgi:hypothetical protein